MSKSNKIFESIKAETFIDYLVDEKLSKGLNLINPAAEQNDYLEDEVRKRVPFL